MARALGACVLLAVLLGALAPAAAARAHDDQGSGAGIRQPSGEYRGRKVGARTEVRDVEGDGEVQELGRFSVAEYNRQLREGGGGGGRLEFGRVVAAQRQVVSGLKYYLRVVAVEEGGAGNGGERVFDAVVVVKPWLDSRTLLTFAPAAAK
uniref:Cysteine proteinase inhibitor B n=1 Tax=Zea mays TaxID=4577 RepID=B6SIE7_MAIZE|nr:cysteine proteinase inhibitor B [Zea mays]